MIDVYFNYIHHVYIVIYKVSILEKVVTDDVVLEKHESIEVHHVPYQIW